MYPSKVAVINKPFKSVKFYRSVLLVIEEKVEVIGDPFRVCLLEDFLDDDDDAIEGLKEELMKLKLHQKSNDLYQFKQVCYYHNVED